METLRSQSANQLESLRNERSNLAQQVQELEGRLNAQRNLAEEQARNIG
ncbi:MAG: hypothetical protein R2865_15655 [Deinococcales bacterium]